MVKILQQSVPLKKENPCKQLIRKGFYFLVAEGEGFEPPDLLQSTVFKTAALNRSATPPVGFALQRYISW